MADLTITQGGVMELNPCGDWPETRVAEHWARRGWDKRVPLLTVASDRTISVDDRMWLVLKLLRRREPDVARRLAYSWAERACRVHAAKALAAAGLDEHARAMRAVRIVDADSARAARAAARAARAAARAAVSDSARAAGDAAWAAGDAAWAARYAAWSAARDAARDAGAAAWAARAAGAATRDARDAARDAERKRQMADVRRLLREIGGNDD